MRRYIAEALGTFAIVFTGCGALLVGGERLGDAGVALAFGMAFTVMLFAVGPVSGGHCNPALSVAMVLTGRFGARELLPYIAAQIAGGAAGAAAIVAMANGRPGGTPRAAELIAVGYDRLSPGFYGWTAALVAEFVLSALFVFVVLAVTAPRSTRTSATGPFAAGVAYALVHLVGLPVTKLAANPARAIGPALLAGGAALDQVWLFVAAPIAGAAFAALAHRYLQADAVYTAENAPASRRSPAA